VSQDVVSVEIDIQIKTAHEYPRDMVKVKAEIIEKISDPEIAESMWYTLERYDKKLRKNVPIVGPSIRLAEILYTSWGNIRVMSDVVETTPTHCTARGVAIDLEKNTGVSSNATVPIYGSGADAIKLAHMRAQAVARRNAIFQVIPGVYQKQAMKHAQLVYAGQDIGVRRARMVEWFGDRSVAPGVVCAAVAKLKVDELNDNDLEVLTGMRNRIVDDNKPAAQAMGQRVDEEQHTKAEEQLNEPPELPPNQQTRQVDTPQPTLSDALAAEQNALVIAAKKKFGKQFDDVWKAATAVAGTDYDVLKSILSAGKTTVGAALLDDDPNAALLAVAKSAITASRAGAEAGA